MDIAESLLFTPGKIGQLSINNRFVRSATYENTANSDGSITEDYLKIYRTLSKGNIGLIISGMIFTSIDGKSYSRQAGLHSDHVIQSYSHLTDMIHENESKIFAQLCHGGRQTQVQGLSPRAPSVSRPDLIYKIFPRSMNHKEIVHVIKTFGDSAKRAKHAGFDGIQIHAAHGYLISEFLSPFFNSRNDEWGGSSEKRFRLLKEVFESVRDAVGTSYPVTVKINIQDYTPKTGLSLEESIEHIKRLVDLGIDGVEISCGTLSFSMFNQSRGNVPVQAFAKTMPLPFRPFTRLLLRSVYPEIKFRFYENYNLWASKDIKPIMGDTPLILVGGLRSYHALEDILNRNEADFVSMCRPFIRQPLFVKNWSEGNVKPLTCTNCNNCLGGIALHEQLRCNRNRVF
ncbi:MAG: NADH:flavin oxidoreductase [Proteobacteria bacterium]|nr:NADH:flavin oxidoreductase [Pseudomonadota bacterium]